MNESAHLARFLLLDIIQRIEVFDFAGEPNRKLCGVKLLDVIRPAFPFSKRSPGGLDRITNRRNQSETSNNDATLQNEILHRKCRGRARPCPRYVCSRRARTSLAPTPSLSLV